METNVKFTLEIRRVTLQRRHKKHSSQRSTGDTSLHVVDVRFFVLPCTAGSLKAESFFLYPEARTKHHTKANAILPALERLSLNISEVCLTSFKPEND